jgi:hypothetical protein
MNEAQRTRRIFDRVNELTENRSLSWSPEPQRGAYAARAGDGWVRIASEDGDDSPPIRFSILGSKEEEISALRSIADASNSAEVKVNSELFDLYRSVRAQVLGIDDVFRNVEEGLGL